MLVTMLRQSWTYDFRRKLMAVATVFLAAGLVSALLTLSINIGDKMAREMKSYGANIEISPDSQSALPASLASQARTLDRDDLLIEKELPNIMDIFWRNNIIGFAPFVRGRGRVVTDDAGPVELVGTFFDKSLPLKEEPDYRTGNRKIARYWQVTGRWPDDEQNEALAGQVLAEQKGWQPGDVLVLEGEDGRRADVRISGILTSGSGDDRAIILPLASAQRLLKLEGRLHSIRVSALTVPENALSRKARENLAALDSDEYDLWFCTAFVSSIAFQLENALNNARVKPIWQVAASEGLVITRIQSLLFVVTLAALVAAAMGIGALMSNAILQRAREIGLMKALGAHNWQVYLLFYSESILCGLLGGLLGSLAGWGLARIMGYALFDSAIRFHWITLPLVLIVALIITLTGTYFPSRRIAALYPIEVLYGRQ